MGKLAGKPVTPLYLKSSMAIVFLAFDLAHLPTYLPTFVVLLPTIIKEAIDISCGSDVFGLPLHHKAPLHVLTSLLNNANRYAVKLVKMSMAHLDRSCTKLDFFTY